MIAPTSSPTKVFPAGAPASAHPLIEPLESRIAPAAITTIDLSSLDGTDGIKLSGSGTAGRSVSDAGDINADGFDDFIIGAKTANSSGHNSSGTSYLVFGKADFSGTANLDLSTLDGTDGFAINGTANGEFTGYSVSAAGDVNGDGFDDLIIGATGTRFGGISNIGAAYVVFGRADFSSTSGHVELSALNGTNGFRLNGVAQNDNTGTAVSGVGDLNGDGFADLLVGAPGVSINGVRSGGAYVVFGQASFTAEVNLSTLDGTNGFKLRGGTAEDIAGNSVSGAGDVNGDGFADLVVGAPFGPGNTFNGASYVVFGRRDFSALAAGFNLDSLNGSDGFVIKGAAVGHAAGWSVSGAGDVNGDGFDDVFVGANFSSPHGSMSGAGYVVFGRASFASTAGLFSLSSIDGNNGFKLSGVAGNDETGFSVSGVDDFNGDGFDDVLIGAPYATGNAGASYLVFGKADFSGTANLELSALGGTSGITLNGAAAGAKSGISVSGAGDVNGDGFHDLIVGAPGVNASYVVFGFDTGAVTHPGGSGAQTLTGNAGANVFVAGTGGDTMIGNGGPDVFHGGQGDDLIAISDLTFRRIDGGNGTDTLRLDGSGITFTPASYDAKIRNLERIDLTGTGDNTLNVDLFEVLGLSGHTNTLTVDGNAGDIVNLGVGWTHGADEVVGPTTYATYTQDAAKVRVALGVTANVVTLLLTIDDVTMAEGDAGTTTFSFAVHLSIASTQPVTVTYSTANGTAIAPGDYTSLAPTLLTFAVGETMKTIDVAVRGETLYEQGGNETFFVNLSGITQAQLGDTQAQGTITNDETAPANVANIDAKHPFTFFDANHDKVTVKLSGIGTGTVTLVGDLADGADISEIHLTDTDVKSALSVNVTKDKTTGDGVVGIGEVTVPGALKSFTAKAADFSVSGLRATGVVKAITARDLLGGEIFTGGAATDKLALTLGAVSDGTLIDTPETIATLKAVSLGDSTVKAAAFGAINITAGALAADITTAGAIAKITIKGGGLSGDLTARSFGPVSIIGGDFSGTLTSLTDAATLGKIAALKSLTVSDGDLTGDVRVLGLAGAIGVKAKKNGPGGNVTGATIVAGQIASLTVARDLTSSIVLAGADLGADHAFAGGDDTFLAGSIGTVKITGNVSGASVIGAGADFGANGIPGGNDDSIVNAVASLVKSFTIAGTADPDSHFIAGLFKAVKIEGAKIDPTGDARFKVA